MSADFWGKPMIQAGNSNAPKETAKAMDTTATPFGSNLEYLASCVDHLRMRARKRLLLRRLEGGQDTVPACPDGGDDVPDPDCGPGAETAKQRSIETVIRVTGNQATARLEALNARIAATLAEGKVDLPLERLAKDAGLCEFEKQVILAVLGPNLDGAFGRLLECLQRGRGIEIRTVLDVLCEGVADKIKARRYFIHSASLLTHGLLNLSYSRRDTVSESDFQCMDLEVPRRISSLILGEYDVEDSLVTFSSIIEPEVSLDQVVLPPGKKQEVLQLVLNRDEYLRCRRDWGFDDILSYGKGIVMLFSGPPGTGKTMLAHALAKTTGHRLMLVDLQQIKDYNGRASFEDNLKRIFHEARLQNAVIMFDEADELFGDRNCNSFMPILLREFEALDGVCVLATNRRCVLDAALDRRILYKLDFGIPTPEMRAEIWRRHLPASAPVASDIDFKALGDEFEFSGGYVKNAVLLAMNRALQRQGEHRVITMQDLRDGACLQRQNRLEAHADKVSPKVSLADVVLPEAVKDQVRAFVAAARKRSTVFTSWAFGEKMSMGKSLSCLFMGPSGVGKSVCAEAVACELGQVLYPVRLSSVISAYVGQTERNLAEVFKSAREAQALLFFDEADSLFTARLDGGGHHAHYLNQQVNCLLTEMEKHDGIVILATNRPEAFDQAFERRIRYRIAFPAPDARERLALWRAMIPAQAPINGVDFARLAQDFEFTGGTIRNVLLRAAFEAACNGQVITDAILRRCADDEQPLKRERQIGFGAKA